MLIFVVLGTQKFQFNRLLKALDEQIITGKISDDVFAQIGESDYIPREYKYTKYIDQDKFEQHIKKADIIITHGGTGTIVRSIKENKKVIAVPRLSRFNEHVDDHQLQIIKGFENEQMICACLNCDYLWKAINKVKSTVLSPYISDTNPIIRSIDRFIIESCK